MTPSRACELTPEDLAIQLRDEDDRRHPRHEMLCYRMMTIEREHEALYGGRRTRRGGVAFSPEM